MLASPVIFWKFWSFVAPGLYSHEKKIILPFSIISTLCFLGGGAFAYYIVFPPAFHFLMGYSDEYLSALPTIKEYFSLALRLLIGFGIIFEMPVAMVLLARLGIVSCRSLHKNRKYGVVIAFLVAAVATPTSDVVNQLLMALPLILLYEISIVAVWLFGGKHISESES